MGTHPIFESDFDCLTDIEMGKNKFKISKKEKNPKKSKGPRQFKDKEKSEKVRKELNLSMDKLVTMTKGTLQKEKEKTFEKIGLPQTVKTDDIEALIHKL